MSEIPCLQDKVHYPIRLPLKVSVIVMVASLIVSLMFKSVMVSKPLISNINQLMKSPEQHTAKDNQRVKWKY